MSLTASWVIAIFFSWGLIRLVDFTFIFPEKYSYQLIDEKTESLPR